MRANRDIVGLRTSRPKPARAWGVVRTAIAIARRVDDGSCSGPSSSADDLGDRGERQAGVVVQHEDRTVLGREASERALDQVAIENRGRRVSGGRSVDRQQSDPTRPPSLAAGFLVTRVHEQAMEPDVVALRVPQPRDVAPRQ
jgi:hypothetical protein